jgi:hypothetical protein
MEGLNEWLWALQRFTRTPEAARAFQDLRFQFAYALGNELIRRRDGTTHVRGPVLYGIYLDRIGPLYVGHTTEAERRLRDLPIGESHHLANTFPPGDVGPGGLEHLLQRHNAPLFNARRKTTSGGWVQVDPTRSKSAGALIAPALQPIWATSNPSGRPWQR